MKRSATTRFTLLLLISICAVAAFADAASAQRRRRKASGTEIKMAILAPEGTTWANALHDLDKELRAQSNGALGLRLYAGGVQGDERVVIRKMKMNQLHGAGLTGIGLGELVPEVRLLEIPFQFVTYKEIEYVREKFDQRLRAKFDAKGYELLGWTELGFINLFAKQPVGTVQAIREAKPWVWEGDQLAIATYRAFGVNPTPLPLPEVLTSLQTGLINVVYQSPAAAIGFQWYTKVSFQGDVPLAYATGGLIVSKRVIDKLSPEHQRLLRTVARTHTDKLILASREENAQGQIVLRNHGIEISRFNDKERATLRKAGYKVSYQLAGDAETSLYPKSWLDELYGHLKDFRSSK